MQLKIQMGRREQGLETLFEDTVVSRLTKMMKSKKPQNQEIIRSPAWIYTKQKTKNKTSIHSL